MASIAREAEAAFKRENEAACQKLQQQNAQLQQGLDEERSKGAAAKASHDKAIADLAAQHGSAMAELKSQHAAEAKDWEAALARRDRDSKLFRYVIRGSSDALLSGLVPLSIFQAEPNSALATLYNGAWDYAKDAEGRAVVNSDPDNWPIILNWLSFGTVPNKPTASLLSECKFWQLDKMLAAIDANAAPPPGVVQAVNGSHHLTVVAVSVDGNCGFTVRGEINHFPTRVSAASKTSSELRIPFAAAGRDWVLRFGHDSFP